MTDPLGKEPWWLANEVDGPKHAEDCGDPDCDDCEGWYRESEKDDVVDERRTYCGNPQCEISSHQISEDMP